MKDSQCEFCLETYPPIRYFFHSVWQCFCMVVCLIRFTIWSLYITNFPLKNETKMLCTSCKHSGQLHLISPAEDSGFIGLNVEPSHLAFSVRYAISYPLEQQFCIRCATNFLIHLGKIGSDVPPDHEYNKMDNLTYLELKSRE